MKNTAYFFISIIGVIITLIYGKDLLIPFIFALLFWFMVRKIRLLANKVTFIKKKGPLWLKNLLITLSFITIFGFISKLLLFNINSLAKSYPVYEANIGKVIAQLNDLLQINIFDYFKQNAGEFDFGTILKQVFKSLTDLLSNAFIILFYALFIFLEEANFYSKLKTVLNNKSNSDTANDIIVKIESSISKYIGLKTFVSFVTGLASYIVLLIIGIDAPLFWAFLIFTLNFIPTIGSLIGTLFPAIFCMLQFGDVTHCLMVLGFVGVIQIIVGNLLEPKLMGNSLNISPLVAIIALSFWGALWGITGMLLSVPITVIMVIIFSHFEKTKSIAIMLSEKGKI
jgi:AI-2 transport protein TqsA